MRPRSHKAPQDRNVIFEAARVYAVIGDSAHATAELNDSVALGYDPKDVGREPDLKQLRTPVAAKPPDPPVITASRNVAPGDQNPPEVANLLPPTIS